MLNLFGVSLSEDESRKRFYGMSMILDDLIGEGLVGDRLVLSSLPYEMATIIRDERNELNLDKRVLARKERFYDLLERELPLVKNKKCSFSVDSVKTKSGSEAILQLSDFHYGINIDNYWNRYDVDIAKKRLESITAQFIDEYKKNKFKKTHIVIQGDLISGYIHTTLRLRNQENVVNQIFGISKLLSEMFSTIVSAGVENIFVYFVDGNHDRMVAKKEQSLEEENFVPIIKKFVKHECGDAVTFCDSIYGNDISEFNANGLSVVCVHGDKDPFPKLKENICGITGKNYDIILSAHRHRLEVNDDKGCLLIANGSLAGMDDYAKANRMNSIPSQNLIIVKDNGSVSIHHLRTKGGD